MKLSAEGGQAKPETIMLWVKPIVVYLAILPFYLPFTGLDLQILTQVTQFAVQNSLNKAKKADFQQKS